VIHRKVTFKGKEYWYHGTEYGINISPLEHYSADGELLADPFNDLSYAVLFPDSDEIMRFGQVIGTKADLEFDKE
jgi:hypothetical protein